MLNKYLFLNMYWADPVIKLFWYFVVVFQSVLHGIIGNDLLKISSSSISTLKIVSHFYQFVEFRPTISWYIRPQVPGRRQ